MDKWKIVPVEPTDEMIEAAGDVYEFDAEAEDDLGFNVAVKNTAEVYRAMLAAAPALDEAAELYSPRTSGDGAWLCATMEQDDSGEWVKASYCDALAQQLAELRQADNASLFSTSQYLNDQLDKAVVLLRELHNNFRHHAIYPFTKVEAFLSPAEDKENG